MESGAHPPVTQELRRLLSAGRPARALGAHDALTAVLAERAGFDVVWASSFTVSASRGLPDLSLLTMTDQLLAAQTMASACRAPVLADCDTGFGGCLNVAHTIRMYEQVGVAGVCIEDKQFPKTNSFISGRQELLDADSFARKVEVAKRAQLDESFVVVARTEALVCGRGVDEALARADCYMRAGADAILVHSKDQRPDEVERFLERWHGKCPVAVVPTTYPSWSLEEAERAGASLVIYANQALRAAVRAMSTAMRVIYEDGCSAAIEADIASIGEIFDLEALDDWLALDA